MHSVYSSASLQWPFPFCLFIYGGTGDVVSRYLLTQGSWEPAITRFMLQVLSISSSHHDLHHHRHIPIVDFGANLGWFSVIAALREHPVIAIEPSTRNLAAIRASFLANNISSEKLLETHHVALHRGFPASSFSSSSSLDTKLCLGYYEKRQKQQNPGNYFLLPSSEVNSTDFLCDELVSLNTLDNLIGNREILFVKADCEGCEANALLGAENLLRNIPPCVIYTEATGIFFQRANISAKEFFLYMRRFGYRVFHFRTEQKKRGARVENHDDHKYSLIEQANEDDLLKFLAQPWQIDIVYIHPRCFSSEEFETALINSH